MDSSELASRIARLRRQHNDDGQTEAKASSASLPISIWDTVSAFANTRGGTIILGLDEGANFVPAKGFAIDKVISQFVEGMGDGGGRGRLEAAPKYLLERMDFEGSQVVVIEVEELDPTLRPCYVRAKGVVGGSYKRVDDKDIKLSAAEIYELTNLMVPSHADRAAVPEATLADLDPAHLQMHVLGMQAKGSRAVEGVVDESVRLARLNVTDGSGSVRMAGLLVFGAYPQQYFPKLVVDVAVHPGVRKGEGGARRFVDRTICEGPLPEMIDEAVRAISKNLRTASYVDGMVRRDELELPVEALREAVANAVVHREYSGQFLGRATQVDLYDDRLEITNPGGLWGGITTESLGDGLSLCRNPTLMSLMSNYPAHMDVGPATEGNGTGIALMRAATARRGLPEPIFEDGIASFRVSFARPVADGSSRSAQPAPRRAGKRSYLGREEWLSRIMEALDPQEPRDVHAVAEALGKPVASVRAYLSQLVGEGKVVPTAPANSRDRKYLLA